MKARPLFSYLQYALSLLFLTLSMFFQAGALPAHAASYDYAAPSSKSLSILNQDTTITVNTDTDEDANNTTCSLREAIIAANTDTAYNGCNAGSGTDTISFAGDYTITLNSQLPAVTSTITINGNGAANTVVQASTCNPVTLPGDCTPATYRVFFVDSTGGNLTLDGVTVRHGNVVNDVGGGIHYNSGVLTITNSTISDNQATNAGGGIYGLGRLTVINSTISGNNTNGTNGWGGGIAGSANNITNSMITGNKATSTGGGIFGPSTITDSTISGNTALRGAGISLNGGTLTVTGSMVSDNIAPGGVYTSYGGGIFNDGRGDVSITDSTLSGNTAEFGGGISNDMSNGRVTVTNSTISDNTGYISGGGISNSNISNAAVLAVINTTISGNTSGLGGGIYNNGTLTLNNSTISTNQTLVGDPGYIGGGIYNETNGTLNYSNTIIAKSTSGGDCVNRGTIGTNTHNLVQDGSCNASQSGDPKLDALADNGGLTQTMALLSGSPAIDAGDNSVCAASPVNNKDQRGIARPQNGGNNSNSIICDIGSFEVQDSISPSVISIVPTNSNPSTTANIDFTVTFSEPVTGVDMADFNLTTTDVSAAAISSINGSDAVYTVTVNSGSGNGSIRLDIHETATITDVAGNPIAGLPFTSGETNYIVKTAPVLVAPSDGTNLPNRRPDLDWTNFTGATAYQLQISRNNLFTLLVKSVTVNGGLNSAYALTIDLPANTLLYWRARAVVGSSYSPWSMIHSFKTANPPSVPVLSSPTSNALTQYTPHLDWGNSTLPLGTSFDHYQVQLDDNSDFGSPVVDAVTATGDITASSYTTPTLADNTKYFWRVRSFNTLGQYSSWSNVFTLRTALLPPTLNSPEDTATLLNKRPTFGWSAVPGAASYNLQVARDTAFSLIVLNINSGSASFTPGADLPANALLHWRVRSTGTNGPSAWSAMRSFTTANPPSVPVLSSPASNALTQYTPHLDWGNSTLPLGTSFDHYQVQLDDNSDFGSPVVDAVTATGDITASSFTTPTLADNTKYFWRVRAFNSLGQYSSWSNVFTLRTALLPPTLNSPEDGAISATKKPVFNWAAVAGASGYTIQISKNASFGLLVLSASTTATTYTPGVNLPAGTLYWRVRATGTNGPSNWSTPFTLLVP